MVFVILYFNPRPREEGDCLCYSLFYIHCYFNPRPREEGDARKVVKEMSNMISIHALVKRATNYPGAVACPYCDFNPRPREEGDSR